MDSKLKTIKTKSSTVVSTEEKKQKPPAGTKIRNQTIRTETEEIENGWLVTKSFDGTYYTGKGDNDYSWFNYSLKWYSKEDPLTITVNDKDLADAFDGDL